MARNKRPVPFEIPRDEDGHFLPKEMWTKKEIREHERLKEKGLLSNPIKKTKVAGSKRAKDLYIQPQGKSGKFVPKEKWSSAEKRLAKKAAEKGQTIAAQLPRDEKGRFLSPTGKKKKKKETAALAQYPMMPQMPSVPGGDGSGMHQGNVTVVYPPYPPQAAQPAAPYVMQMPQQAPGLTREDIKMLVEGMSDEQMEVDEEGNVICDDCMEKVLLNQDIQLENQEFLKGVVRDVLPDASEKTQLLIEQAALEKQPIVFSSTTDIDKNPRSRYPRYYVKRTFSDRVGDTLSGLARNPLLAIVAIGAVVAIGYALYRAFKAFRFRMLNSVGVDIVGGAIYFPGEDPYTITDEDKLWLARSIWGEVNRDPSAWNNQDVQQGGAAVLWAFANHYITVGNKRNLYPTLGEFVQAYSQPINPRWDDASDSRCQASPAMCTADRLAFRQELRNMPWTSFPTPLQNLVLNFAAGQVQNPVGTRTDFRASGTGYVPADPLNVAGNIFGTAANARRRPVEQVA